MSTNTEQSAQTNPEKKTDKKSRLKNIIRAAFTGTMVGGFVSLSLATSENKVEAIGLGGYLITKNILRKFLSERPLWIEALVESGLSVSILIILDEVIMDVWQLALDMSNQIYYQLPLPSDFTEGLVEIIDSMKEMPEFAIYIILFLLLTQSVWLRGARGLSQKSLGSP